MCGLASMWTSEDNCRSWSLPSDLIQHPFSFTTAHAWLRRPRASREAVSCLCLLNTGAPGSQTHETVSSTKWGLWI